MIDILVNLVTSILILIMYIIYYLILTHRVNCTFFYRYLILSTR